MVKTYLYIVKPETRFPVIVLDSQFKFQVRTFYYTEHLFQHIVL
jgi:hypothetical protein